MSEELLINVSAFETRVALLAGGHVQELHLARDDGYSRTGNIYLGKVVRVVPGMQAAFVDCGLDRPGFLHVRDIEGPRLMLGEEADDPLPDIRDLLREGQELMVQVAKDPIANKGARLTTKLAIASRYVVLMPFNDHIGISQRIDDAAERERLKDLVAEIRAAAGVGLGFIVRTAADGIGREPIAADVRVLAQIWEKILAKKPTTGCPSMVYQELPIHIRMVRDMVGPALACIQIDHRPTFDRVCEFVREFLPQYVERLSYYDDASLGLFASHRLEDELDRSLARKVALKSGGHLVIEQTEAMITVDVNTGSYLGSNSLEETVFRTNLEAARAVPRQLRLRNLGGIIVIDFIDMEQEEHQRQVLQALEKACEGDPAKIRMEGFSSLGLVQMSRKRTRESLTQQVCEPCQHCAGVGVVKTAQTTGIEVFRAIMDDARIGCDATAGNEYLIRANESVVDRLLDEDADHLAGLSERVGRRIRIQVEPSYGAGQFDVVLVDAGPAPRLTHGAGANCTAPGQNTLLPTEDGSSNCIGSFSDRC